jgi:hypothetical protein
MSVNYNSKIMYSTNYDSLLSKVFLDSFAFSSSTLPDIYVNAAPHAPRKTEPAIPNAILSPASLLTNIFMG